MNQIQAITTKNKEKYMSEQYGKNLKWILQFIPPETIDSASHSKEGINSIINEDEITNFIDNVLEVFESDSGTDKKRFYMDNQKTIKSTFKFISELVNNLELDGWDSNAPSDEAQSFYSTVSAARTDLYNAMGSLQRELINNFGNTEQIEVHEKDVEANDLEEKAKDIHVDTKIQTDVAHTATPTQNTKPRTGYMITNTVTHSYTPVLNDDDVKCRNMISSILHRIPDLTNIQVYKVEELPIHVQRTITVDF